MTKIEIADIISESIIISVAAVAIDFALPPLHKIIGKITTDDDKGWMENSTFKDRLPMAVLSVGTALVLNKIFRHYYPKK